MLILRDVLYLSLVSGEKMPSPERLFPRSSVVFLVTLISSGAGGGDEKWKRAMVSQKDKKRHMQVIEELNTFIFLV